MKHRASRLGTTVVPVCLIIGLLLALAPAVLAQPAGGDAAPNNQGSEYWLAFPQNYFGVDLTTQLIIAGEVGTSGTAEIPGQAYSTPFSVPQTGVVYVTLPADSSVVTIDDGVEPKGIHVTASADITIFGFNRLDNGGSSDGYLGLPSGALGTEYVVLSYATALEDGRSDTLFAVVATDDATVVTITPSVAARTRLAGEPYTVSLDQGDVYQLSSNTYLSDLTGTIVTSDKPVALFGSQQCAEVPTGTKFCEHLVEQIPPTETWGKSFVTMPLASRQNGDRFRVIAATDGTSVTINGAVVATLQRGQFHEQIIDGPAQISANQPVLVAQYANGAEYDNRVSLADPTMMLVPPVEQFLSTFLVATPEPDVDNDHYVNVLVPSSAVQTVVLDGTRVPESSFTPIGTSGYSGAQLTIGLGMHLLTAAQPIGAMQYGFGFNQAYGYPSGLGLANLTNVAPAVEIITPVDGAVVSAGTVQLSAAISDPNAGDTHTCTINWGDGTGAITGDTSSEPGNCIGSKSLGSGTYDITVTVLDALGLEATDTNSVVVVDTRVGPVVGSGMIRSPRGAVVDNPSASGYYAFRFAASYGRRATTPVGMMQFVFGRQMFYASSLDWLVVDGAEIEIQGTGSINGRGSYGFLLTAIDGRPDQLRVQIWNKGSGNAMVYDNGTLQPVLGGVITVRR